WSRTTHTPVLSGRGHRAVVDAVGTEGWLELRSAAHVVGGAPNSGWSVGDRDMVLHRGKGRHGLAVVVKLRGGPLTSGDHPQLVGALYGDLGFGRVDERRAQAAGALVADH